MDSVNSIGMLEDLNNGPRLAKSGMAASCSEKQRTFKPLASYCSKSTKQTGVKMIYMTNFVKF